MVGYAFEPTGLALVESHLSFSIIALAHRITQDGGTKFLVNQNANAILWHLVRNSLLKACIDDLLTVCNGDHLLHIERFFPTEEPRDVGRAMVEREQIERSCIACDHE